jgi:isoleucyl-tRNA synthetase
MSRYEKLPTQVNFPELEESVLKFWDEQNVFKKSLEQRKGCKEWVFYDGPPGTNGRPHVGHMLQSALKDLWPRYKTMRGFHVSRRAGWDTHGLPIELKAEKELGIADKSEIPAFGVEKFQEHCRSTVFRFKDDWERAIRRVGRFLDLDDHYATLTNDYIQSDWWVLRQIWDKGLLYRDVKIMPFCARCGTSLSSHEVAQGYKDVKDLTCTARFELLDSPSTFLLAWTTTPWTLIGNVALALGPDITYAFVKQDEKIYILAEALIERVLGEGEHEILERKCGKDLEGLRYKPLWDYFNHADEQGRTAHRLVADNYVTADDGTGIVHLALYGEDDHRLIKAHELPRVQHIDETGHFTSACTMWAGRYFKEDGLDVEIIKDLAARGLLHSKAKHEHSYPHCYKCENPLMYFAKPSWFIKTTAVREQMIQANREINWIPSNIRDGRFGSWLENNIDWALSRERYWGSPLPVWICASDAGCKHQVCIQSMDELQEYSTEKLSPDMDLHMPWIDKLKLVCPKCDQPMTREPYVLDCWFNAGLMPWGQFSYPAKPGSKERFESQFPADFISEGLDQTRGWFYTMLAVSTILTGKSSFKNVICTGLIADKDGRKMSKTFGNVIDPMDMFDRFGADAVRWTFFNSHPWNSKRFSEGLIRDAAKQVLLPFWNICSFFTTYAEIDGFSPEAGLMEPKAELDRWILSATERLSLRVIEALEAYDVFTAADAIVDHLDELSNWYVRRSRSRFWKSEDGDDKQRAYSTLYRCIKELTLILAPFCPFITETVYQRVIRRAEPQLPESVHLCDWPEPVDHFRDRQLEVEMDLVYHAVKLGRALRSRHQLKVRQPLAKMLIVVGRESDDSFIYRMSSLIREELNVREIEISRNESELVEISVLPNFRSLGKTFGKQMKEAAAVISTWGSAELDMLEHSEMIEVLGKPVRLEDLLIQRKEREGLHVITEHGFTVALDAELTDDLVIEGLARELVNRVQNQRKDSGLAVSDRIRLTLWGNERLRLVVETHRSTLCRETLCEEISFNDAQDGLNEITLNDMQAALKVERVGDSPLSQHQSKSNSAD